MSRARALNASGSTVPGCAPRLIEAGNPSVVLHRAINQWSKAEYPSSRYMSTHRVAAILNSLEAHGVVLAVLEPGA